MSFCSLNPSPYCNKAPYSQHPDVAATHYLKPHCQPHHLCTALHCTALHCTALFCAQLTYLISSFHSLHAAYLSSIEQDADRMLRLGPGATKALHILRSHSNTPMHIGEEVISRDVLLFTALYSRKKYCVSLGIEKNNNVWRYRYN